ncbi:hypothetical protein CALVIDRAFT_17944 [Calocera viscosa TUFC12733]|uniref:Uncharacterized protein n=1 Tax=Calocera viscosa (strain TUFC12733) TaxID=1330018 RepID=A0A167SD22_CALVF|nr:hypothetical protein CALVIDRAFT_17944 [Calocera viscosa TUFC12733]
MWISSMYRDVLWQDGEVIRGALLPKRSQEGVSIQSPQEVHSPAAEWPSASLAGPASISQEAAPRGYVDAPRRVDMPVPLAAGSYIPTAQSFPATRVSNDMAFPPVIPARSLIHAQQPVRRDPTAAPFSSLDEARYGPARHDVQTNQLVPHQNTLSHVSSVPDSGTAHAIDALLDLRVPKVHQDQTQLVARLAQRQDLDPPRVTRLGYPVPRFAQVAWDFEPPAPPTYTSPMATEPTCVAAHPPTLPTSMGYPAGHAPVTTFPNTTTDPPPRPLSPIHFMSLSAKLCRAKAEDERKPASERNTFHLMPAPKYEEQVPFNLYTFCGQSLGLVGPRAARFGGRRPQLPPGVKFEDMQPYPDMSDAARIRAKTAEMQKQAETKLETPVNPGVKFEDMQPYPDMSDAARIRAKTAEMQKQAEIKLETPVNPNHPIPTVTVRTLPPEPQPMRAIPIPPPLDLSSYFRQPPPPPPSGMSQYHPSVTASYSSSAQQPPSSSPPATERPTPTFSQMPFEPPAINQPPEPTRLEQPFQTIPLLPARPGTSIAPAQGEPDDGSRDGIPHPFAAADIIMGDYRPPSVVSLASTMSLASHHARPKRPRVASPEAQIVQNKRQRRSTITAHVRHKRTGSDGSSGSGRSGEASGSAGSGGSKVCPIDLTDDPMGDTIDLTGEDD